jgi:hypothetical protein
MLEKVEQLQQKSCNELFKVFSKEESAQFTALLGRLNIKLGQMAERAEKIDQE